MKKENETDAMTAQVLKDSNEVNDRVKATLAGATHTTKATTANVIISLKQFIELIQTAERHKELSVELNQTAELYKELVRLYKLLENACTGFVNNKHFN